jgi:hypothetical protein
VPEVPITPTQEPAQPVVPVVPVDLATEGPVDASESDTGPSAEGAPVPPGVVAAGATGPHSEPTDAGG